MLLLLASLNAWAAPVLVEDLRSAWMVFEDNAYRPADSLNPSLISSVYFPVDPVKFGGHQLKIRCMGTWHLFVNGQLVSREQGTVQFSVDSLRQEFGQTLFVGVHAISGFNDASTQVVSTETLRKSQEWEIRRPPTFFRDFGILISVFLLVFFLFLFRSNPQLTLDYFSFSKIFSASERNETQLASRITSSANLLFYLFCALLTGFLLTAIFYSSSPSFMPARAMPVNSMSSALAVWLILSSSIFVLLAAKLIVVLVFSTLFNFRETMSFQFFNFLRFVLFTALVMALASLVFFAFRVDSPQLFEQLISLGLALLTIGSLAVLLKLLQKSRFSFFHLFSYLCVSEFIPLVIIFKIFY